MRFTDLTTGKEATVEVPWQDDTVTVRYLPGRLSAETVEAVMSARSASDVAEKVAGIITGWDVLDDDGVELPPSVDVLKRTPLPFIGEVFARITQGEKPAGEASSSFAAG